MPAAVPHPTSPLLSPSSWVQDHGAKVYVPHNQFLLMKCEQRGMWQSHLTGSRRNLLPWTLPLSLPFSDISWSGFSFAAQDNTLGNGKVTVPTFGSLPSKGQRLTLFSKTGPNVRAVTWVENRYLSCFRHQFWSLHYNSLAFTLTVEASPLQHGFSSCMTINSSLLKTCNLYASNLKITWFPSLFPPVAEDYYDGVTHYLQFLVSS